MVTYDYNPLGQVGAITTPEGDVYTYAYNAAARLAGVTTPTGAAISLDYDDGGRLRHIVRPGSTIEYQYNARDWITAVLNHTTGGATLFDSAYAYQDGELWDHTGNPLVRTEIADGTTYTTTYRYDALGRLTEEARTPGDYSRSYGYDLVGNRTSETRDGVPFTYGYDDNNKLTSLTGGGQSASFGYDGNGSMTSVSGDMLGSWTLVYDDANRPTSVTYPTGVDTYIYNAFGDRTRATLNGRVLRYVYDGDRVLEQTDDSGNLLSRYATAGASYYDQLLEFEFPDGRQRYPLYDMVGTARRLADASGTITDAYSLDAFGRALGGWGSTENPHRYGAQWGYTTDPSGMQQLGARFYWPEIGRFIQQDTEQDDIDPYLYVGNNPLVAIDPAGLKKQPCPTGPKPKTAPKKPAKPGPPPDKPKPNPRPKPKPPGDPCWEQYQQDLRDCKTDYAGCVAAAGVLTAVAGGWVAGGAAAAAGGTVGSAAGPAGSFFGGVAAWVAGRAAGAWVGAKSGVAVGAVVCGIGYKICVDRAKREYEECVAKPAGAH